MNSGDRASPPSHPPLADPTALLSQPQPNAVDNKSDTTQKMLHHYDSAPNLHSMLKDTDNTPLDAGRRLKRKLESDGPHSNTNLSPLMDELRSMFDSFSSDFESRFNKLHVTVSNIEKQNVEITKSLEFLSVKYDEALNRILALETEKKEDKKQIATLDDKIELLERKSRSTTLEIRNLPTRTGDSKKTETKKDLCSTVKEMGRALKVEIQDQDIKDIYRIKSSNESKSTVITELNTTLKKEAILQAIKAFNKGKSNNDKFNTEHLHSGYQKTPIFISESLTKRMQKLFYQAREFARLNNYSFCWISRGIVYLRKAENLPMAKIYTENDLARLTKSD